MDTTVTTVKDWTELGIYDRIPIGVQSRHHCPECTPHRKPENQRKKDFVISENGEVGHCHHCQFTANIMTYTPRSNDDEDTRPRPKLPPLPASSFAGPGAPEAPKMTPDTVPSARDAWRPILEQRGLSLEVLEQDFGVKFIQHTHMGPTMVIPVYHPETGELCNHKYRSIDKDFRNDSGTHRPMYNLARTKDADTIVIVEGEMDVFAFDAAGFPHAISVPDGAPTPGSKNLSRSMAYLEEAIPYLEQATRVILAVDNDEPGDFLRKELENRIGVGTVAHIRFPDGIKDANDALVNLGNQWLKDQVFLARSEPANGVYTPEDSLAEITHALRYGFDTGTRIGFPNLDRIYRPTDGHLTIVTGHAGSGKSTILDNFVMKLAPGRDYPICYFSPEQMPLSRHLINLAEIWIKKPIMPSQAKKYGVEPADEDEVLRFIHFIQPYISHISPESAGEVPDLDTILELATAEVRRNGIRGLILDPWNEIEAGRPKHITETEWVSIALGKIRRWARKHMVHVWLVAHPKKMRAEDGKDAVPGLGDISGSNNFRNKADYGLTIHRNDSEFELLPGQNSSVSVIVTKARWRDSATVNGKAHFLYDPVTNSISVPPDTHQDRVQGYAQSQF